MPVPNSARHLAAALLIILRIAVNGVYSQDPPPPYLTYCSGDNFTESSPYESNLRRLISDLVSSTPTSASYFSLVNSTTSPTIYGLAQCRPDVNSSACAACLNDTAAAAPKSNGGCALKTSGYLRYDSCLLIYSDQNFSTTPQEAIFVYDLVTRNASSAPFSLHIQTQLYTVMLSASKAAFRFDTSFAAKTSADVVDIYTMGWCSMDLSTDDCFECLKKVSGFFPAGKTRGTCATVSCVVKFDTQKFYGNSVIPAELPGKNNNKTVIAVISGAVALLLLFTLFAILLQRRIRKLKAHNIKLSMDEELSNAEIKMIDFSALKKATNNFAIQNKLGQGGFGPVYKGLLNGLEIAVKRLSATSLQGIQEMKNEIHFVANLRHRNLVRLLGYCLQGEEKLLIYEFLPNTSLDKFLFNPIRKTQLDWETRLKIIEGVGRGLLYLHEDSHLRIVHRDLKASNILLDSNMNPKISDFGLAKLFKINETERNTSRIAGTLGYMAPEYVLHGRFSTKSDVFSYGVLVLEIITGMKLSMYESEEADDLQSYVWEHWREGKALEVVDGSLEDRYSARQVLRCVQIGLLCVQVDPVMRPKMGSVVTMLSSSSMKLPNPSMPTSYRELSISIESAESAPTSMEETLLQAGR